MLNTQGEHHMTRKLCKIVHDHDMFGHSVKLKTSTKEITLQSGSDTDWQPFNKKITSECYWFRSPDITPDQLRDTTHVLNQLESDFEFRVWESATKWDASLKVTSESDAHQVAWSLMGMWAKWDADQEKSFKTAQKPVKPLKVESDSDGNLVIKGKLKVNQVQLPD
jgi:hypothetical protein